MKLGAGRSCGRERHDQNILYEIPPICVLASVYACVQHHDDSKTSSNSRRFQERGIMVGVVIEDFLKEGRWDDLLDR